MGNSTSPSEYSARRISSSSMPSTELARSFGSTYVTIAERGFSFGFLSLQSLGLVQLFPQLTVSQCFPMLYRSCSKLIMIS